MEDYTEEENDQNMKDLLVVHASQLREHFDNVQILVSTYDPENGTIYWKHGIGDKHARYGLAKMFVIQEEEDFKNPANEQSGYE